MYIVTNSLYYYYYYYYYIGIFLGIKSRETQALFARARLWLPYNPGGCGQILLLGGSGVGSGGQATPEKMHFRSFRAQLHDTGFAYCRCHDIEYNCFRTHLLEIVFMWQNKKNYRGDFIWKDNISERHMFMYAKFKVLKVLLFTIVYLFWTYCGRTVQQYYYLFQKYCTLAKGKFSSEFLVLRFWNRSWLLISYFIFTRLFSVHSVVGSKLLLGWDGFWDQATPGH